jgi:large subunit ribosomal protein L4
MAATIVYNLQKDKVSEVELKNDVFDVPVKRHVLHQVVVSQLCSKRVGTASAKGRSDVESSGTKLWRQKGTGRARVGPASSPTRRGGGVAFGPIPRKYVQRVPKKVKKGALRMALTDKVHSERLIVVEDLNLSEIKTKSFVELMKRFDVDKVLIVTGDRAENLEKSSRNVPWVKVMPYQGLNVYDILRYDHLIMDMSALGKIEEALVS